MHLALNYVRIQHQKSACCRMWSEMTEQRRKANQRNQPISIYEVHLGSWRRNLENNFWRL